MKCLKIYLLAAVMLCAAIVSAQTAKPVSPPPPPPPDAPVLPQPPKPGKLKITAVPKAHLTPVKPLTTKGKLEVPSPPPPPPPPPRPPQD